MEQDIRWVQRLQSFGLALVNLNAAVDTQKSRELTALEEQGMIKAFELVYELAWNTIKDFYEYQGDVKILGSRDAFRLAFKDGLIDDGDTFMNAIKTRQLSVHSYSRDTAQQIQADIVAVYHAAFVKLYNRLCVERDSRA